MARIHRLDLDATGFGFLRRPELGANGLEQELAYYERYLEWAGAGPRAADRGGARSRWLGSNEPSGEPEGLVLGRRAHRQRHLRRHEARGRARLGDGDVSAAPRRTSAGPSSSTATTARASGCRVSRASRATTSAWRTTRALRPPRRAPALLPGLRGLPLRGGDDAHRAAAPALRPDDEGAEPHDGDREHGHAADREARSTSRPPPSTSPS